MFIIKGDRKRIDNSSLFNYLLLLSYYISIILLATIKNFATKTNGWSLKKVVSGRFGRSVEDSAQGSVEWTYLLCSRLCFVILLTFETSRPPCGGAPRRNIGLPLVMRERRPSSTWYFISRRLGKKIIERAMSAECPRILSSVESLGRGGRDTPWIWRAEKRAHASESITLVHEACQGYL